MGKVCSLLLSLDEKLGRIAAAQERPGRLRDHGGSGNGGGRHFRTACICIEQTLAMHIYTYTCIHIHIYMQT